MRCQLSRHSASPLLSCPPCSLLPWPSFTGNRLWHSTQVCHQEAPTALRAKKKKKKKQGTDFILGRASSQVSSLLQYREVSPHTSRTGTPPRASLPCKPEQARKRVLEMLWFQSSPQKLVLADREMERKGIIFSLHQATLMPLDRKEQKTCLCVEKEGREEM